MMQMGRRKVYMGWIFAKFIFWTAPRQKKYLLTGKFYMTLLSDFPPH